MARLLNCLGGQHPNTIFSVILGPFAAYEETTFLKFQKKFFSLHPVRPVVLKLFKKKLRNGPLAIFLMAHGPLEKLAQINTKQHVDFLLYQCDEGTCFFANLFKENEQFTRVRLKSHIAVSFSETNTAAATHQVFTFKPSAKKT